VSVSYAAETAHAGIVAGVDEAGRGPLAGPVVAAAVILDPARIPAGLDDSKKLSPARREALYEAICATAEVGIGSCCPDEIDRHNILAATMLAMTRAVATLQRVPTLVLVDGNRCPKWRYPSEAIIGGDARIASIAAASIIAKVTRDREMVRLAREFPGFGWDRNKGYPTPEHLEAVRRIGITMHHRRSFAPVQLHLSI
jgi:ribonuclease HII